MRARCAACCLLFVLLARNGAGTWRCTQGRLDRELQSPPKAPFGRCLLPVACAARRAGEVELFVAASLSARICVVRLADGALLRSFDVPAPGEPRALAVCEATGELFAVDRTPRVLVFDTVDGRVLRKFRSGVPAPPAPAHGEGGAGSAAAPAAPRAATRAVTADGYGLAVSPSGAEVFVTDGRHSAVRVFRGRDGALLRTLRPDQPHALGRPVGVALSPDGRLLYVADRRHGCVFVLRADDGACVACLARGLVESIWAVALAAAGDQLLVTGDKQLLALDPRTGALLRPPPYAAGRRFSMNATLAVDRRSGQVAVGASWVGRVLVFA